MRVIKEFPFNPFIKATLFSWNGKYILKLESGNLEQTYKISELDVSGQAEVEEMCSRPEFKDMVSRIFGEMDEGWSVL
jgi:hypothetical protein